MAFSLITAGPVFSTPGRRLTRDVVLLLVVNWLHGRRRPILGHDFLQPAPDFVRLAALCGIDQGFYLTRELRDVRGVERTVVSDEDFVAVGAAVGFAVGKQLLTTLPRLPSTLPKRTAVNLTTDFTDCSDFPGMVQLRAKIG